MKYCLALLFLATGICRGQGWELEIMTGVSGYNGDLTQKIFSPRSMEFATAFNLRYNFDDIFILRAGIARGTVQASDRYNSRADLKSRNLDFRTNITEVSLCGEFNLFEPEFYRFYPYVFGGIGIFHFNPYTHDRYGNKIYLQPLGTEGQGLPAYPGRKPYHLTQVCLPFGGGLRITLGKRCDLAYEIGGRILFTDYLDDVSTTYVNKQELMANSRPETAELAYRQPNANEGDVRGNPKVKDWYFISGIKLLIRLGRQH